MTSRTKNPQVEENFYQILEVPKIATMIEIRHAYEENLEETHLEALAAYSLFPEEQTERKLLQFSQAFVTLANPVARAKYDDELQQGIVSEKKQPVIEKEYLNNIEKLYSKNSAREKTKTVPPQKYSLKKVAAEKENGIKKNVPEKINAESEGDRRNYYEKLAVKNELAETDLEEFYATFRTHGSKLFYNGTVLQQIRKLKSVTLEELAKITCIRITYLKAIEDENFPKFPSEIYLKGYLLCYVEALKLPTEKVLTDYILLYKNSLEPKNG